MTCQSPSLQCVLTGQRIITNIAGAIKAAETRPALTLPRTLTPTGSSGGRTSSAALRPGRPSRPTPARAQTPRAPAGPPLHVTWGHVTCARVNTSTAQGVGTLPGLPPRRRLCPISFHVNIKERLKQNNLQIQLSLFIRE